MVNTGKPSGACGTCRERRIKCDEAKPVCLKCTRSGRTCSGYSHGLKMRDQTQKTIIKAKFGKPRGRKQQGAGQEQTRTLRTAKTASPASTSSSSTVNSPQYACYRPRSTSLPSLEWPTAGENENDDRTHRRSLSIADATHYRSWSLDPRDYDGSDMDIVLFQNIDTPLAEQARCYFLSSYVVYAPKSEPGMFTFIPAMLASNDPSNQHFEDLFTAVSIAAFSLRSNASHAAGASRWHYGKGVAELRKILGDKQLVKSDAALASTILLGVHEGLVTEGMNAVTLNPHFEGAITLLRLRGDEQFATPHSTEMFDFVMNVLMRQYELDLVVTEEDLCRWAMQASLHPGTDRTRLMAMWIANLRLKTHSIIESKVRSDENIEAAKTVLSSAQQFEWFVSQRFDAEESELLAATGSLSVSEDQTTEESITYSDWWTASRSLNKYALRLLLCHMIADISDWLSGPTDLFQGSGSKAAKTAIKDINSIIMSLPYLCRWKVGEPRGASSPCGRDDAASVEGITSLLVIWPLYLAGESRFATQEQKEQIRSKLRWIGDIVGIKHASGVSDYLKLVENGATLRDML